MSDSQSAVADVMSRLFHSEPGRVVPDNDPLATEEDVIVAFAVSEMRGEEMTLVRAEGDGDDRWLESDRCVEVRR